MYYFKSTKDMVEINIQKLPKIQINKAHIYEKKVVCTVFYSNGMRIAYLFIEVYGLLHPGNIR